MSKHKIKVGEVSKPAPTDNQKGYAHYTVKGPAPKGHCFMLDWFFSGVTHD